MSKIIDYVEVDEAEEIALVQGKVLKKLRDDALEQMEKDNTANPALKLNWNKLLTAFLRKYVAEGRGLPADHSSEADTVPPRSGTAAI